MHTTIKRCTVWETRYQLNFSQDERLSLAKEHSIGKTSQQKLGKQNLRNDNLICKQLVKSI